MANNNFSNSLEYLRLGESRYFLTELTPRKRFGNSIFKSDKRKYIKIENRERNGVENI